MKYVWSAQVVTATCSKTDANQALQATAYGRA